MAAGSARAAPAVVAALLLLPLASVPAQPAAAWPAVAEEALAHAEAHRAAWGLHPEASLEVAATRASLGGEHAWLRQRLGQALVEDGGLGYHRSHLGHVVVQARLAPVDPAVVLPSPALPRAAAEAAAVAALGGLALRAPVQAELLLAPGDLALTWRVRVAAEAPPRDWEVRLDAHSGHLLALREASLRAAGAGTVFHPNPMASSGNGALRDNPLGITTPELAQEFRSVVLRGLSEEPEEQGRLVGPYVRVAGAAFAPDRTFAYGREDPRFEEVMVYYYVDEAQRHVQSLGFDDVSNRQVAAAMYPGEVNAFYSKFTRSLHFGFHGRDPSSPTFAGPADAAEDGEIVVHEYGHAVLDDVLPGLAGLPGDAIHEGYADFFATSFLRRFGGSFDACFGEWMGQYVDAGAPDNPPCLRLLNQTLRYPEHFQTGLLASPHRNGLIWAGALEDLAAAHDRAAVERVALEAHYWLATVPEMPDLGPAFLLANRLLGSALPEEPVAALLLDRGLLGPAPQPQDDAGSGGDAGNQYNTALALPPGGYDGLVGAAGDREDWYAFAARAGEVLIIDVAPSQAGTPGFAPPSDPPVVGQQVGLAARVVNPTWRVLGPVHGCDSGAGDLRFVLQATQDGAWRFWLPEMPDNDPILPTPSPYRFRYRVAPDLRSALPMPAPEVAQGTAFVGPEDSLYVRLDGPGGAATVAAPSGAALTVRKAAAPGVVIAHVGLDGGVLGVRVLSGGDGTVVTEGDLSGQPADGTWVLRKAGQENSGLPVGVQLRVAGKVFDDVAPGGDPIEDGGLASSSAMATPVVVWNWHHSPERFDAAAGDAVVPRPATSPMCPRVLTG